MTACSGGARPTVAEAQKAASGAAASRLDSGRLAILTPTAGFGNEESRQALALTFGQTLGRQRPDLHSIQLADTLSAINSAGLAEDYDKMYVPYRNSGLFDRDLLRQMGEAVGARYFVQLKIQSVNQSSKQRFGYFGISILQTQVGSASLFAQIWDAHDGRLVWEAESEAIRQSETFRDRRGVAKSAIEAAVDDLIRQFPK